MFRWWERVLEAHVEACFLIAGETHRTIFAAAKGINMEQILFGLANGRILGGMDTEESSNGEVKTTEQ